jgi:hypothetical protein
LGTAEQPIADCEGPSVNADSRNSETGKGRWNGKIFAYSRLSSLNGRKMFEAPDGERSSILQNARQTEMGTRATRPSEDPRQSQARTSLAFGRAGWMRGNAEWMNAKAECWSDHYVTLVSFVTAEVPFLENSRAARLFDLDSENSASRSRLGVGGITVQRESVP